MKSLNDKKKKKFISKYNLALKLNFIMKNNSGIKSINRKNTMLTIFCNDGLVYKYDTIDNLIKLDNIIIINGKQITDNRWIETDEV